MSEERRWDEDFGEPVYVPEPPPPGWPGYRPADPPGPGSHPPAAGWPPYGRIPYGQLRPPESDQRVSAPILGWLLLGAAVLSVLGAVLPWVVAFGIAVAGTEGDGQLVVGCAVAIVVCGLAIGTGRGRLWASLAGLVFGLLIVLIALVDVMNIGNLLADADLPLDPGASVGGGLWLTLAAGILASGVAAVASVYRGPLSQFAPPAR